MKLSGWARLWIVAAALLTSPTAVAQKPADDKAKDDEAMKQLILQTAEVVGFQTTANGIQVLYRVKEMGAVLVLCSWKTPSKPVASGCVVLPPQ